MRRTLIFLLLLTVGVPLCACSINSIEKRTQATPTQLLSMHQEAPPTANQTSSPFPAISQVPEERKTPTMKSPTDVLKITIVYDNNAFDSRLKTAWGFSALVEYHEQTLLFDTGEDGQL